MNKLTVTGRILFALPFAIFGLNHFFMESFFSGLLTTFIPGGGFTVVFTGVLLIVVSVLIIIKKYVKEAAVTLAVLLTLFILTIHIPHLLIPSTMNPDFVYRDVYEGTNINMFVWINFFKDISLLGATLLLIGTCENSKAIEK
jgi:uncharacterized membrane protein YphA (DoxX/SURF4 family)